MSDDARAELVRAVHRTLATRGVRFAEASWWDPPPAGIEDANLRTDGELDLVAGWYRTRTTFPASGGCASTLGRLSDRLRAVPVIGSRLFDDDEGPELWAIEAIGCGRRRWTRFDDAWRASEDAEPARPLSRLEEPLRADEARAEGEDVFGRRIRWRAPTAPDEPMPRMLTPTHVVSWGWAWLDPHGYVRRVQSTRRVLRTRIRTPPTSWTILEVVDVDVPVAIEAPGVTP